MSTKNKIILKDFPQTDEIISKFPNLKAVFFDMDGTLFNTEKFHEDSLIEIAKAHKIKSPHTPESLHQLMMGKADHLVYEIAKDWENFPKHWSVEEFVATKNNFLMDILEKNKNNFFDPRLHDFIKELQDKNFLLGLVTSSEKVITKKLLEIADIKDMFHLTLTRDDCLKHKPDPWPYLEAMKISACQSHEVLIFEDSEVGVAAAVASGAHVIQVKWY